MKKNTLADIAKALQVSKSLVSLVLNGSADKHGINKETQQKVLKMANEMNYVPNSIARSLRVGRTNTIGLIVADIANHFFAEMARSIEDQAHSKGYELFFSSSDESAEREIKLIELMRNRNVDGMIISTTLNETNAAPLQELQKANFPIVLIDRYIPAMAFDYVVSENQQGAFNLTNHICMEGKRKRVALFTITPSHLSSINDRVTGYKEALKHQNIPVDEELIFHIPFDDVENEVATAFDKMKTLSNKVDAIISLNNNIASACLTQCKIHGLEIPKDIALATFDDLKWFELFHPSITSISQPITNMGEKAMELLIQKIEGKSQKNTQVKLPVTLTKRESSN